MCYMVKIYGAYDIQYRPEMREGLFERKISDISRRRCAKLNNFNQIMALLYVTFLNKFSRYVTNVINITVYPEKW